MNTLALNSTGYLTLIGTLNLWMVFLLILCYFHVHGWCSTSFLLYYYLFAGSRLVEIWVWCILRCTTELRLLLWKTMRVNNDVLRSASMIILDKTTELVSRAACSNAWRWASTSYKNLSLPNGIRSILILMCSSHRTGLKWILFLPLNHIVVHNIQLLLWLWHL